MNLGLRAGRQVKRSQKNGLFFVIFRFRKPGNDSGVVVVLCVVCCFFCCVLLFFVFFVVVFATVMNMEKRDHCDST